MNKHISLVKKWLNDPDSVSQKELRHNADDSDAEADAADAAAKAATLLMYATEAAAVASAAAAAADVPAAAARWVKRYEELTK